MPGSGLDVVWAVIQQWLLGLSLSNQTRSNERSRRQLEPDESHYGACALGNTPSTIAQIKEKEEKASPTASAACKLDVKENRRKKGRTSEF